MNFSIRHPLNVVWIATGLLGVVFIAYSAGHMVEYQKDSKKDLNYIERITGSFQPSAGNLYGNIYSLDGKPMLKCLDLNTGDDITGKRSDCSKGILYCATQPYFAPVIGHTFYGARPADNEEAGMLKEDGTKHILQANSLYCNAHTIRGDSIITTIVSSAQEEAVNQLQEYADASMAVVNADGALLVNAGTLELKEFQNSDGGEYIANDADAPAYVLSYRNAHDVLTVGSSFKTISARVFQQNDANFPPEWSVYNDSFDDISSITIDGYTISNWEINSRVNPLNYYTYFDNEVYHRQSSLADALIHSSNTYFLRHATQMGLTEYRGQLDSIFQLYQPYDIGDRSVDGLQPIDDSTFSDILLPYGQSAVISPARLAAAYNHAIGGKFYRPFEIAQIRTPNNEVIFSYQPEEISEYSLDIDVKQDVLVKGLGESFLSYIQNKNGTYHQQFNGFSPDLLGSGGLLAKRSTAVVDASTDNRTMAITLLNPAKDAVVCTAVIAVRRAASNQASNDELIYKILKVLEKTGVLV